MASSEAFSFREARAKHDELAAALATGDASFIAAALHVTIPTAGGGGDNATNPNQRPQLSLVTDDGMDWSGVLNALVDAMEASRMSKAGACFAAHSTLHSALNHIFGASSGNILVPALQKVCRTTYLVALAADQEQVQNGGPKDRSKLQAAVTLLQESFSKTLNDRKEYQPSAPLGVDGSKKAGVLYIVNQLFSMYFRLNTLRLCKNLLRPVESRKLHQLSPDVSEMVTYNYYVGRLSLFEDQYEMAEQHLDFALRRCFKRAVANKRRILNYLLPVKLLRGRLPTTKLLDKYALKEYIPFVEGIRKGDLRTFNDGLEQYQDLFIRRGTYLLMEKCKTVCFRNLLKRMHHIKGKPHLSLDQVGKAFKYLGMPVDLDEVECILANLIYRGHVRGYISHEKRVLVLSKRDAFPTSAVIVGSKSQTSSSSSGVA